MYELTPHAEAMLHGEPSQPLLVMHLRGWIDAGSAASLALDTIKGQLDPAVVATFDDDQLIDYRSRRPTMSLDDGIITDLEWPVIEAGIGNIGDVDVLLLHGAEPDRHWRSFASAVVDLAEQFGVSKILGLGAFPAPTPHTRLTTVVSTSTSQALVDAIGHNNSHIEVPAGINAAIETEAGRRGVEAATLWAPVPHYAAAMDYPAAAKALLETLNEVGGTTFDISRLGDASDANHIRIDELVAGNPQHEQMVKALEDHVDEMNEARDATVPSADELADQIQAFLRDEPPQ